MAFHSFKTTLISLVLSVALHTRPSTANTPIHQSIADSQGLYLFVLASRPVWQFGIPSKLLCWTRTSPCYPDAAVDPRTGAQNPGAELASWPNAEKGCRSPSANGGGGGSRGQSFPTYYVSKRCSPDEIRVGYWVYFPKDGFTLTGHRHDWEYYIVVWRKDSSGNFTRHRHILSYHSGRTATAWRDVKDSVNDDLSRASGGNHSKVYVAWSKHAMFDTKKTTVCSSLLQSTLVAYRSDDWWYYPEESDLLVGDTSSQIGRWIDDIGRRGGWGSASSWPATRGAEICSLEATQDGKFDTDPAIAGKSGPSPVIKGAKFAVEGDGKDDFEKQIEEEGWDLDELFPFGFPGEDGELHNSLEDLERLNMTIPDIPGSSVIPTKQHRPRLDGTKMIRRYIPQTCGRPPE